MSSEAAITFSCDGVACESTVVSDHPFDLEPDDWFTLGTPDTEVGAGEALHFCSVSCLYEWTSFARIAAAEGP